MLKSTTEKGRMFGERDEKTAPIAAAMIIQIQSKTYDRISEAEMRPLPLDLIAERISTLLSTWNGTRRDVGASAKRCGT